MSQNRFSGQNGSTKSFHGQNACCVENETTREPKFLARSFLDLSVKSGCCFVILSCVVFWFRGFVVSWCVFEVLLFDFVASLCIFVLLLWILSCCRDFLSYCLVNELMPRYVAPEKLASVCDIDMSLIVSDVTVCRACQVSVL